MARSAPSIRTQTLPGDVWWRRSPLLLGFVAERPSDRFTSSGFTRLFWSHIEFAFHARAPRLSKKLYVGNLAFSTTEDELRAIFEQHGSVGSVNVITDRETGRPRGFAFVEMDDASAADAAMHALDGSEVGGRSLKVSEAHDKRSGGGGGGRDRY